MLEAASSTARASAKPLATCSAAAGVTQIFVILMIMALFLAIMTAMAGSSRTLYQGSRDGWLPKYLGTVNEHGAPRRAMWTDFAFNVFLLALASDIGGYFYVLAISNVGYILFNFLNLNAGWIHRIDSAHMERPWKAPTWLIGLNTVLAFVNALFLGAGAKVWGYENALWSGLIFAALIFPVFWYRHYIVDKGKFPKEAYEDLGLPYGELGARKAGMLPYLALILGAAWFYGRTGSSFCRADKPISLWKRPPAGRPFSWANVFWQERLLHFIIAFWRESPDTWRKSITTQGE
jgi:amino acid transporter